MTHKTEKPDIQQAIEILRSAAGPLMDTIGQTKDRKLWDLLVSSLEHALVKYALEMEDTQAAAAGFLGISRNTLRRKISKYRLAGRSDYLKGSESAEGKP